MSSAKKNLLLIGLTGSIASGKSTALNYFKKLGAAVLSADELVRQLYQKPAVRKELTRLLGTAEPTEIAKRVFQDETSRKQLETFLHPLVWKKMQTEIKKIKAPCVVLEIPLLFEAGFENRVDTTVVIIGGKKSQHARLKARGLTAASYQERLRAQLPEAEKIKRADICIINDKTPRELEAKIAQLYLALKQIYHF